MPAITTSINLGQATWQQARTAKIWNWLSPTSPHYIASRNWQHQIQSFSPPASSNRPSHQEDWNPEWLNSGHDVFFAGADYDLVAYASNRINSGEGYILTSPTLLNHATSLGSIGRSDRMSHGIFVFKTQEWRHSVSIELLQQNLAISARNFGLRQCPKVCHARTSCVTRFVRIRHDHIFDKG